MCAFIGTGKAGDADEKMMFEGESCVGSMKNE
jgi:hypothetical protein